MQREIDRAEALLMKWADWMRIPEGTAEWYPEKASGGFIESWRKDSEDEAHSADMYEIGKIKASIESLIQPHQRIIHKMHGISYMVWDFKDEEALYLAAKEAFSARHFGQVA